MGKPTAARMNTITYHLECPRCKARCLDEVAEGVMIMPTRSLRGESLRIDDKPTPPPNISVHTGCSLAFWAVALAGLYGLLAA